MRQACTIVLLYYTNMRQACTIVLLYFTNMHRQASSYIMIILVLLCYKHIMVRVLTYDIDDDTRPDIQIHQLRVTELTVLLVISYRGATGKTTSATLVPQFPYMY